MNIGSNILGDVKLINLFSSEDKRGCFTKIMNDDALKHIGIDFSCEECFYSVSQNNVVRGMHFQIPPYEQDKLVHVIHGKVCDVVVDLRKTSDTYGQYAEVILSSEKPQALYIPKGFGHGFMSLEDNTCMMYMVSCGYNRECDWGIRWNSFGYNWKTKEVVVSERDSGLPLFSEYISPF